MLFKKVVLLLGILVLLGGCMPSEPTMNSEFNETPGAESSVQLPLKPQDIGGLEQEQHSEDEEVTQDSYEWFSVPAMTEDQQQYYDSYIEPLLYNSLLFANWSEEDYQSLMVQASGASDHPMLLMAFEDIVGQEDIQLLRAAHGDDLPADTVEEVLLERFAFTLDQLREILSNSYQPDANTYVYVGGRGGGPLEAAVVAVQEAGEFLYVDYVLLNGYSGLDAELNLYFYKRPGRLTLKKNGDAYQFWGVEAGQEEEASPK